MKFIFGRDNETNRLSWLEKTLKFVPEGFRLLDAGAGELKNKVFCKHLIYVSQDICQYEGTGDGVALQTGQWDTTQIDLVSDITAIPVPDESFDAVLCTEVFEHVPDPLAALQELARLVKPGGSIILTAPFCSLTHFAPYHYATGLSRYWYERHLLELGFSYGGSDTEWKLAGLFGARGLASPVDWPHIFQQRAWLVSIDSCIAVG